MTPNDQAVLSVAMFAIAMVALDVWRTRPRSLYLDLGLLAVALLPIVNRVLVPS